MMDKNSVEYALQMFYDSCNMSDEEFNEKYPDEPGDAYHHPCPIYEDGYIDYSWGYMGD